MKNREKIKNKIITILIVTIFLHILMPLSTLAQETKETDASLNLDNLDTITEEAEISTISNTEEAFEEVEDVEESFDYNEEQEELEEETVTCIEEKESNIEEVSLETKEATISNANENFEKNENKEDDFVIENEELEEATKSNIDEILIEMKEATMSNADILIGTWSVDGITSYYFDAEGSGAMILPKHRYSFKYIIEENKLILDFEDNKIKEVTFIAFIKNDELVLEKTEEEETIKFILKEVKDLKENNI